MPKPARKPAPPAGRSPHQGSPPPGARPDIAAPYAFVPLNRHVYCPPWRDRVSMDVPFSDGLSGTLAIEVEAVTPLFVGAHTLRPGTKDSPNDKARFTVDGQSDGTPAIPGTSLKGAIRSVIEIAAFGRIGPRMDDLKFSMRDLHNPQDYLQYMTEDYRPTSKAGWLRVHPGTGDWLLAPCDYSVARQTDLETYYKDTFGGSADLGRKQTAREKYLMAWRNSPLSVQFDPDAWRARDDWAKNRVLSRADNIGRGATQGTIVFTGQPQDREGKRAQRGQSRPKQVDFIFHSRSGGTLPVPPRVREDFESVHRDPNTRKPNKEWDWWRARLYRGEEVPVFWLDDGRGGVRAMGLAMMFRLAYRHSTRDFAGQESARPESDCGRKLQAAGDKGTDRAERQEGEPPDLADLMFGTVNDAAGLSLKGRVRFTLATQAAPGDRADEQPVEVPLLSPKAGFYPAYVTQQEVVAGQPLRVPRRYSEQWKLGYPGYTTYMADGATIRGWKRYPVSRTPRQATLPEPYNGQVLTRFTPVGRGATFRGTVHVHNLQPAELGALAWALTWGFDDRLCHALGGVKPFGYGAARIRILPEGTELEPNKGCERLSGDAAIARLRDCVGKFKDTMDKEVQKAGVNATWEKTMQIEELLASANLEAGDKVAAECRLGYLPTPKAYQDAKKNRAILPLLTGRPDPESRVVSDTQQAAPPAGPGPGAGRAAARPAVKPAPRRATVDGEPVEILGDQGSQLQVRFLGTGDIEWLARDELD